MVCARIATGLVVCLAFGSCATAGQTRPRPRSVKTMRLVATAYCDSGPTKSGVRAQDGVVAADSRLFPIGTVLEIVAPGKRYAGVYTVMDTGSNIKGRVIDIFMPSCQNARRFGRRKVRVRIVRAR
jgi:3D (Asp-Asp-Asp) domain-containing protein